MQTKNPHQALKITLILSTVYFFAEFFGGLWTNSLALLADAGHMGFDVIAITLGLWASRRKEKNANSRAVMVSTVINALTLILVSVFILVEAIERWHTPEIIRGDATLLIAIGGLAVNYLSTKVLQPHHTHDLNVKGVWLHVLSDLLGSVAAILSGACVLIWNWAMADAIFSLIIALFIFISGVSLLREAYKSHSHSHSHPH